jgi:hypothetical protein
MKEESMERVAGKARNKETEAAQRKAREDKDRLAGNATAAAESFIDRETRAEMSDGEKLQRRIDDEMTRTP